MAANKVIFDKKDKEESLIPNKQLEQMFMSIADDEQMRTFQELVDKGLRGTATAYASHRVTRTFNYWRDTFIKQNGDLEYLQFMLWRKTKK